MEETCEITSNDLQECFSNLKKQSTTYKLGQPYVSSGDDVENPLHKQFAVILSKIDDLLSKQNKDDEEYLKTVCMKSSIIYEKAKMLLAENFLKESKQTLEEGLNLVAQFSENPKASFLYLRIVNHLSYVLSRLGELDKAKEMLLKAIEIENKCKPEVFSTDDLFLNTRKDEKLSETKLSRLIVNNMQMLAWIYSKLGNADEHLKIQHDVLQKQLDFPELDILRWAESCFRLAGMYVGNNDWENARYHLAATEAVLNPLEISFVPNRDVHAVQADLARCWVYYGLQLFEFSRKGSCEYDTFDNEAKKSNITISTLKPPDAKKQHDFAGLTVDVPATVPTSKIENSQQAKVLFGLMQKFIKRARLYYTLRDYPLQYVNLCLDLSELYRYLALFETDLEGQYQVQKKRYDALEALSCILKEVRPNCYVAVTIELTKEIIEVQMEMMNLNLRKMHTPPEVLRNDINEDVVRRQMNALYEIHSKLERTSSNVTGSSMDRVNIVPENDANNASNEGVEPSEKEINKPQT